MAERHPLEQRFCRTNYRHKARPDGHTLLTYVFVIYGFSQCVTHEVPLNVPFFVLRQVLGGLSLMVTSLTIEVGAIRHPT